MAQLEKNITKGNKTNIAGFALIGGTALQTGLEQGFKYLGKIITDYDSTSLMAKSFIDNANGYSFVILGVVTLALIIGGRK